MSKGWELPKFIKTIILVYILILIPVTVIASLEYFRIIETDRYLPFEDADNIVLIFCTFCTLILVITHLVMIKQYQKRESEFIHTDDILTTLGAAPIGIVILKEGTVSYISKDIAQKGGFANKEDGVGYKYGHGNKEFDKIFDLINEILGEKGKENPIHTLKMIPQIDGTQQWYKLYISRYLNSNDTILMISINITKEVEAETYIKAIMNTLPAPITMHVVDREFNIIYTTLNYALNHGYKDNISMKNIPIHQTAVSQSMKDKYIGLEEQIKIKKSLQGRTSFEIPGKGMRWYEYFSETIRIEETELGYIYTAFDITETIEAKVILDGIMNSAPMGIMVFDNNERISYLSQSIIERWGIDTDWRNLIGGTFSEVITNNKEAQTFYSDLAKRIKDNEYINEILTADFGDKGMRYLRVIAFYLCFDNEKIGYVYFSFDETDTIEAKKKAESLAKSKSIFLANVSHDIRTPMNAVIGFTEILSETELDKRQLNYLQQINTSSHTLLGLINDILDFSKMESEKLKIVERVYSFSSLYNDIVSFMNIRLRNRDIIFITEIDPQMPQKLIGDQLRIKQVMVNILENASKYTEKGYIKMTMQPFELGDGRIKIQFLIQDSGIGIREEARKKIFATFERLDEDHKDVIEGTGLGLSIVSELISMMNGTIDFHSKFGKGTTFIIDIEQKVKKGEEPIAPIDFELMNTRKIFFYDPDNRYASAYKYHSSKLGVSATFTNDYDEAFDILTIGSEEFTHIFIADGDLIERMVSDVEKKSNTLYIALLPANSVSDDDLLLGYFNFVIFKPLYMPLFMRILMNQEIESVQKSPFPSEHHLKRHLFRAPQADILLVEDNNVNLQVAQELMAKLQMKIDVAKNGAIAVQKALDKKYDLVFMDYRMPVKNGVEATRDIRAGEGPNAKTPIIALTASALIGEDTFFMAEGMNDVVHKPIEMRELLRKIRKWLPSEKIESIDRTFNTESKEKEKKNSFPIPQLDTKKALAAFEGNTNIYERVLKIFISKKDIFTKDLLHYYKETDFQRFGIEVHALKSALGQIGADSLSRQAERLEKAAKEEDNVTIGKAIDNFLTDISELIETITSFFKNGKQTLTHIQENNPLHGEGTVEVWTAKMKKLYSYAFDMDIKALKQTFEELNSYEWKDSQQTKLNEISESLVYYRYNEIIDSTKDEL